MATLPCFSFRIILYNRESLIEDVCFPAQESETCEKNPEDKLPLKEKKKKHFLLEVKTQSKLEVPPVSEKVWQNMTPNCSAAPNNRTIWYCVWEDWSRSHYPCTLLSGRGHLAPSPLLIKNKGMVDPFFFPKTHHVNSWARAFHTCSSLPWVQADKPVGVLYQGLQTLPSHNLGEMPVCYCYCIYAENVGILRNWSKVCPGQTQIPCSHLHKVSHTVRLSVQEGAQAPEELNKPNAQKPNLWLERSCTGGRVWQEGTLSLLTDLRFLWDPVVALRNLAHSTGNKEFVVSISFWTSVAPELCVACIQNVFHFCTVPILSSGITWQN